MKSFFVVAVFSLFLQYASYGQDKAEKFKDLMWNANDPAFKVTDVPEKWKNESAVILAQKNYYEYEKEVYLTYLYQREHFHKRIKLLDKASVTEYSEFSFPEDITAGYESERYYVGVKIVKPSGKEIIVNLKDAVIMEKEVNRRKIKYKKLAIPSVEPGDILDYYICMESSMISNAYAHTFPDVIYTLQEKYPIVSQALEFKLKRRCFLNIKTLNGAPQIQIREDPKDDATIYYVNDKDREKVLEKLWHYPYRSVPTIKFQVYYASARGESVYNFLGESRIPKTSISQDEILKYLNKIIAYTFLETAEVEAYLKKNYKAEKDPEKIISNAYDYYRAERFYEGDRKFVVVMSQVLTKRKIPHQLLTAVPTIISTIDQAVLEGEFYFLLKVNLPGKTLYLCPPDRHSLMTDITSYLQGADAYAINPLESKSKRKLEKVHIPVVPAKENSTTQKIQASIDESNFNTIKVHMEVIHTGANKSDDQDALVSYYDYNDEQSKALNQKTDLEKIKNKKEKEETLKKIERQKEEENQEKEKSLKKNIEGEFNANILSVKNFDLKQIGRWPEKPQMIYSLDIEMDGLLKKAGKNYILEAGKLMGKQIELTEEDKKRKFDIYMPYARTFNYEITIDLPEGYKAEGLENFNVENKNETGGFVSTARIVENKLIITTSKYYVNNFEKAENWKKIEDFLEAAYNFTQQKILLKK